MNGLTKVADFEPRDCDDKAICDFMALVLAGGEITPERSGKSHSLGCSAYLSQCVLLLVRSSCTQTPRAEVSERRFIQIGHSTPRSRVSL